MSAMNDGTYYIHIFGNFRIVFNYFPPGTWKEWSGELNKLPLCVQWNGPLPVGVWRLKLK